MLEQDVSNNLSALEELFGPAVCDITTEQLVEDGCLIDVSDVAKEAGFTLAVFLTRSVWEQYVEWTSADSARQTPQDESGRLWDVLYMATFALKRQSLEAGKSYLYELYCVPRKQDSKATKARMITLKAIPGFNGAGEPIITILLPNED